MFNLAGSAGAGAMDERAGFDQISSPICMGGMTIPNLESIERIYPVRFLKHELRRDTCGPGEFRGGTGVDYQVELLVPGTLCFRGEGQGAPSGFGVSGGGEGEPAQVTFRRRGRPDDGKPEEALPAYGIREVGCGVLRIQSAAGGGWGDPGGRDPEAVRRDVRNGILSPEKARADYGIEVDKNTGGKR